MWNTDVNSAPEGKVLDTKIAQPVEYEVEDTVTT
jgi:hypothetical protein